MPLDSNHWLTRAHQARTVAEWIREREAKELLIDIAERYERIAEIAKHKALFGFAQQTSR
jgi:hypothetical protein